MTAKLLYDRDIFNNEVDSSKLNYVGTSFNLVLSTSVGFPTADATIGALYVDTSSGNLYRKTASGSSQWTQISSVTSTVFQNHYRSIFINSAITATDTGSASIGDLVGIYGAGTWSAASSGNLNKTKRDMGACGSQNANLAAGGNISVADGNNPEIQAQIFNGSSWSLTGNLNISKRDMALFGTQNAATLTGGQGPSTTVRTSTELFNGSNWTTSTGLLTAAKMQMANAGTQNAGFIAGGSTGSVIAVTQLFNGQIWSTAGVISAAKTESGSGGSQNAGMLVGGVIVANQIISELFNGSTWNVAGVQSFSKRNMASGGSQNSAWIAGGIGAGLVSTTEVYNGTAWSTSGTLSQSKQDLTGSGGQGSSLITGGYIGTNVQNTELHNQTIYRKLNPSEIHSTKGIGILINASQVQQQGSITTSVVYVANKWLVTNRYMAPTAANVVTLTAVTLTSIQGTAPAITYNFSATVLSLVPGMMAVVASSGATPGPAGTYGTFLISQVTNPTSVTLVNNTSVSQNPATGTISFISTMLAVDKISPQDVVIGRTDDNGYLSIHKPITVNSLNRRLK